MIQQVYKRYVREINLHVHKGGVDLPDSKKIIKKYFQKARPKSKNQQKWKSKNQQKSKSKNQQKSKSKNQQKWKSMDDFQKAWTIYQKARKNHWKSMKISAF